MSKRHRSPLGFLVWRLISRRETAGAMLARVFAGSAIRAPLTRAIRHGSLVTGELCGPIYEADGRAYRPPSRRPEEDITRGLHTRSAARILASFLLYAERTDPKTRKASGVAVWQGNHARRLKLTTERGEPRADGTIPPPGGVREVQRYARVLVGAGVLELLQPNAANVPEGMRAQPNAVGDQWAYNLVTLCHALPLALQNAIRRWRGMPEIFPPLSLPMMARELLDDIEARALGSPPSR